MKTKKGFFLCLYSLFSVCYLLHAQVIFEAKPSKNKLGINERLRIDFQMNQDGDNFTPPNFNGFRVIGGPNQSVSRSWVNGKSSFSKTYSYFLKPTKTGVLKINQAVIEIEGKVYKTLPISIQVTSAVDAPNSPQNQSEINAEDYVHLEAVVSKTSPYLNEGISVVYKLYVSPSVSVPDFRAIDTPKYNNFWSDDIDTKEMRVTNTTYKGKPYRCAILKKVVLYPQKTGILTLEPFTLDVVVNLPTKRTDFFGQRVYKETNITLSDKRRRINVKPLPDNRPKDFYGAVGDFSLEVTKTKESLKALESLQVKVKVSGKGNLKLFDAPNLNFPSGLEVYSPEKKKNVKTKLSGMTGSISQSYTVVPQKEGNYKIASVSFSYFDPKTKMYKTLTSNVESINVGKAPNNQSKMFSDSNNKQYISVEDNKNQFRFLKLESNLKPVSQHSFIDSRWYYIMLLTPFTLLPALVLLGRKRQKLQRDYHYNKAKISKRLTKKYLSEAKKSLSDKQQFYLTLEKALHNYLKSKLSIETSDLSKEKITSLLKSKSVSTDNVEAFIKLFKNCEASRYAPSSQSKIETDYRSAIGVIVLIDKQLS